jgi:hypothetical protein
MKTPISILALLSLCLCLGAKQQTISASFPIASGGGTPISLVQLNSGSYNPQTCAATFTNNTAGHIGAIAVEWNITSGTNGIASVTDTSGNSYTISAASASSSVNSNSQFAYTTALLAHTGTNTVTITMNSTASTCGATAYELTAGSFDQATHAETTNTATPNFGSITTTHNGSFYIAAGTIQNGFGFASGWFTANSPFTSGGQSGAGNYSSADMYYAQTTAGAVTPSMTSNYPGYTGPNAGSTITFHP